MESYNCNKPKSFPLITGLLSLVFLCSNSDAFSFSWCANKQAASTSSLSSSSSSSSSSLSLSSHSSSFGGILREEATFAVDIVTEAVKLCREVQSSLATAKDQADSLGTSLKTSDDQTSTQKADDTPVTAADFAIQGYFAARLKEKFPKDYFLGEEDASSLRNDPVLLGTAIDFAKRLYGSSVSTSYAQSLSQESFLASVDRGVEKREDEKARTWILDPIDGTKGLMTGQGYVVGLALVDQTGEAILGIMGNPACSPSIMMGVKNEGLRYYVADEKIEGFPSDRCLEATDCINDLKESKKLGLNDVWLDKSYNYERFKVENGQVDDWGCGLEVAGVDYPPFLLSRPLENGSPLPFGPCAAPSTICCGSMVKYWTVATRGACGFIQYQTSLKSWDHACGVVCVQESGGTVMDGNGKPIRFHNRSFNVQGGIVCIAKGCDVEARTLLNSCIEGTGSK